MSPSRHTPRPGTTSRTLISTRNPAGDRVGILDIGEDGQSGPYAVQNLEHGETIGEAGDPENARLLAENG